MLNPTTARSSKDSVTTAVWVGDILDSNHTMVSGSDGVFVAAPAWHRFMEEALQGVPDRWYEPPSDVVRAPSGNSWYLRDTQSVARLPNDAIASVPTPVSYEIPADPGTGPTRSALPTPVPVPSLLPTPAPPPTPVPPLPTPVSR